MASALLLCSATTGMGQNSSDNPQQPNFAALGQQLMQLVGNQQAAAADEPVEQELGETSVTQSDAGLLDVHVRDMPISTLLEGLSYEAQANIVTSTSVGGQVSANLYAVTLEQALEAILIPNGYAFHTVGATIFVGSPAEIQNLLPPPETRVFYLKYLRPEDAAEAVKAVLGAEATIVESAKDPDSGSATATTLANAGEDYLVVTAYPEALEEAARVIASIDRRPRQALIEATILRATLNETNQFGIDFTMLGGIDFEGVSATSTASSNLTPGALPSAELQDTTFNVNTTFSGVVDTGGFSFGVIKDSIAAFVRALEEITDVVVVANPKIIALNKQEAEVIVGRRDGYLTTTVTETAAVQTVEFLATGTQIKFRPMINEDGTVRLSVHPKDSNGGLTAANLPFEETTEAHANILLTDGETILIGGLFRERTVNSRAQLPLLGNIPGIGEAFGNRNDQTTREEVIILLTVHVLKEDERERELFRDLLEDVERIRVGTRRGLAGTGRERLAQAFFHEALERFDAGDPEKALLNLRMALHNRPSHLPATKLRERLLAERLWEDEGTRMRTFIWQLIDPPVTPDPLPTLPVFKRPVVPPPEMVVDTEVLDG